MPEDINTAAAPDVIQENEISLLDVLIVLATHKKLILGLPLVAAITAAGISLQLPSSYTATARILPPQQGQSGAAIMLGQLGALTGAAGAALGIKNPNDLYVGMLRSRTVADSIIHRFNLRTRYQAKTQDDTRRALEGASDVNAGKDGILSISVVDEDPKFAAQLANAYVEELYKLTQTLAVTEASQRRLFFEHQLKTARNNLANAEMAFKSLQEKTGLLKLDEQGRASIEAAAALRAQVAAKEVELGAMRTFATERNPDYQRITQELAGLRSQLARFERGAEGGAVVSVGKLPEAGLEYARRMRDLKYSEAVYELLAKQFEVAKLDEARDASLIQVLDRAVPPERRTKPKRRLIVIFAALAAGLLGVLAALVHDGWKRARRNPELSKKMGELGRQWIFRS